MQNVASDDVLDYFVAIWDVQEEIWALVCHAHVVDENSNFLPSQALIELFLNDRGLMSEINIDNSGLNIVI